MGDTKTKSGPLTEKLDLPRGAGGTRKRLKKLRADVTGAIAITATDRDLMLVTIGQHEQALSNKLSSSDKKIAIESAVRAEMTIRRQLKEGGDIRGAALAKIDKKRKECHAAVFAGLIKKVEEAGLRWSALPVLQEYGDARALAGKQVWDAGTPQVANKAADDFVVAADECVRKAKAALTTVDQILETEKKRVANTKRLFEVLADIRRIADEIELATGSPERMAVVSTERDKQYKAALSPSSDPAVGLRAAEVLLGRAQEIAKTVDTETQQALKPLKQRLAKLKTDADNLKQAKVAISREMEEAGFPIPLGLQGLESYWGRVDAKFELADRTIDDKLPASGFDYLESLLGEIEAMLEEIRKFEPQDQDHLDEALSKLSDLTKRHKAKFFDTTLMKYNPKDANVLRMQYNNWQDDCAAMKPGEIITYVDDLVVAAEKAQEKANSLKKLCEETAAAALKTAKGELEALNKAVKKLPKTDSEGHATFHGDYRKSVDELEAALKFSDGPDEAKITKLVQLLPTQLAAIKPGGTLNEHDFLASHKKGLREEQAEGDAKENAKKKLAQIKKLYETTSKKLSNADPADVNELKSIKRSLDEASDSLKGIPPEQAVQRLGQIETRLKRLEAEPGGSAVRARGNLDKDAATLTNALKNVKSGLDTITQAITSGYDGENKDAAVKLVAQAKAALEAPDVKIQTSVREFLANTGSEDLPARLKARELGVSGVRDFRTLMTKNSVLAKLMADDPFTDGAMTSLTNALNGLELNILRGI